MRVHLRTVSAIGHSQAVSMWAWPVAITWCVPAAARVASAPASGRRAAATSGQASSAARACAAGVPGAGRSSGHRAHQPVEHVDVVRQRLGVGVDQHQIGAAGTGRAARRRRSPGDPSGDGGNWRNDGFEAASSRIVTGPGAASTRDVACGAGGCPARAARRRRRSALRTGSPGGSRRKPRSITASTRRPAHACGISPVNMNQVVPHGGPHAAPAVERLLLVEASGRR